MCRVRFGLDGIFFDVLGPCRPKEDVPQPLISRLPARIEKIVDKPISPHKPETNPENKERKVRVEEEKNPSALSAPLPSPSASSSSFDDDDEDPIFSHISISSSSSSSSIDDGDRSPSEKAKPAKDPSLSSSQNHQKSTKQTAKVISKDTAGTQQPSGKGGNKGQSSKVTKASPIAKSDKTVKLLGDSLTTSSVESIKRKVRFSNMVEERAILTNEVDDKESDTSSDSSGSSCDSYVDPLSPTGPQSIFSSYYPALGAFQSRGSGATVTQPVLNSRPGILGRRSSLNSGYGSFVGIDTADVPAFRVSRHPRRRRAETQKEMQDVAGEATDIANDLENDLGRSRFHRQRDLSPFTAIKRLSSPRKRPAPKSILVVPSKVEAAATSESAGGHSLRRSKDSSGSLRTEYHNNDSSPKSLNKKGKKRNYQPPHVSDDEQNELQINPDTGASFRDI